MKKNLIQFPPVQTKEGMLSSAIFSFMIIFKKNLENLGVTVSQKKKDIKIPDEKINFTYSFFVECEGQEYEKMIGLFFSKTGEIFAIFYSYNLTQNSWIKFLKFNEFISMSEFQKKFEDVAESLK